jgi:hypothetical protein
MARPKGIEIKIDLDQIEKLAQIGATQHEMAHFLGVSTGLIEERLSRPEFRAAWDRGQANLKLSLRRQQVKLADTGNVTMLIWLGKQLLNQSDKVSTEVSGPSGSAVTIDVTDTARQRLMDRINTVAARLGQG